MNTPTVDRDALELEAKALGVKGVIANMKLETLIKKIAEAKQAKAGGVGNSSKTGGCESRKFAKFQKKG